MRKSHKLALMISAVAILVVLPVGLAQAVSAPTTHTASVADLTGTSATLRGSVNPNGQATNYNFDWGTTTDYGHQTTVTSAGAGTGGKSVAAAITGLTPGTAYHYRLSATNASGPSNGADVAFTTPALATVSTGGPSSVTSTSAVVNGVVNPQGHTTNYYFQYGATTSYGVQTSPSGAGRGTSNVGVHAALTGLAPGTLYHYRILAQNGGGLATGADQTFTTTSNVTQSRVAFMGRMGFVSPGAIIGVQAGCFGGTTRCGGHVTMSHDGILIGQRNFNIAPNSGGYQNLGINAQGKQMLKANRTFRLLAVDVSITTDSGQHTSQVMHLARWVWN
jgi:phosphodiesterase/alkaline phosphatase D-like protein